MVRLFLLILPASCLLLFFNRLEGGAARLAAEGLDGLSLAMLAIPDQRVEVSIGVPEVGALLITAVLEKIEPKVLKRLPLQFGSYVLLERRM